MAKEQKDPEVDSEFARGKAKAKAAGTPPGVDPDTGERAAVTYRQLVNETGDEQAAEKIFRDVAKAGGYGDVDLNQSLDIRSLSRSVTDNKKLAGQAEDLFAKRRREQAAQHQDNLLNDVSKVLERLKRG